MSTVQSARSQDPVSGSSVDRDRERSVETSRDRTFGRHTELDPAPRSWMMIACGAVVPLGMAIAAAVTTYITTIERVAVTAWIAVAVVGTASVIATAAASRHRITSVDRSNHGARAVDNAHGVSRQKAD